MVAAGSRGCDPAAPARATAAVRLTLEPTKRRYTVVWYYLPPCFKNLSLEKLGRVAFIGAPCADCGFVLIILGRVECWRLLLVIRGSVDWYKR